MSTDKLRAYRMDFTQRYDDDSGVQYAVRLDGEDIQIEAVDVITIPISQLDWMIAALQRIKEECSL